MKIVHTLFLILIAFFGMGTTHARWATLEDLDTATEFCNTNIKINKDGTYEETVEYTLKAMKESGKDRLVSVPLVYNAISTKLEVLAAKAIHNGVEYPVDLKEIEDKPLASSPQGFDQNNQVLIAFPQVGINGKIYLKYKMTVSEAPVPGFYSHNIVFNSTYYDKNHQTHIVSELPLTIQSHDTENALKITQKKIDNLYYIDIQVKKPIIKLPIDEQHMALRGDLFPWITISTVKDWSTLGKLLVNKYEAVVNQPLPALFESIAKEAETKSSIFDKIDLVTTRLSENITYMGDWRSVKGALVPRTLDKIVQSKIGDCKDFSASTVAILRRLGLTAHVSLVNRGVGSYASPNTLPDLSAFNHAFVHVQDNGKDLWIDPTNFTSFSKGTYPDIADRMALVLNPTEPKLLRTKALTAKESEVSILKKVLLPKGETDAAKVTGQLSLTGSFAIPFTGADLSTSKETINHYILSTIADETRTEKWNIGSYNLTSRIVNNLLFNFDFSEKHTQMKTTAGNAFVLPSGNLIAKLLTKTHDRVTDLSLAEPGTYRRQVLLPKASVVGSEFSSCQVESPWFKGSRKITNTAEGIQIVDELVVEKDKILNKDLKSAEYLQLQNKVFSCFGDTALVYKQ